MAGTKGKSGGARPGAGRKPKPQMAELRSILDEAWPREKRVEALSSLARYPDAAEMRLLLSYAYGTPTTLDEAVIAEAVSVEIDAFMTQLKDRLDAQTFAKVVAALSDDEPT